MPKTIITTLILTLLTVLSGQAKEVSKIIAKVNDGIITSKDLEDYCRNFQYRLGGSLNRVPVNDADFRDTALERIIADKLILAKAKEEGITIPGFWIDEKLNEMIASAPSREAFDQSLIEKGLNLSIVKEKIKEQFLMQEVMQKYIKSFIEISPQEIFSYYDTNKGIFYSPKAYIFYLAQSPQEAPLERISDFIKRHNIDEAYAEYPGDIIKLESTRSELREDFAKLFKKLKAGQWDVKKIDDVYYLIYLKEVIDPLALSLDEVKEDVKEQIYQLKFRERFTEWVDELKEDAVIKSYYDG